MKNNEKFLKELIEELEYAEGEMSYWKDRILEIETNISEVKEILKEKSTEDNIKEECREKRLDEYLKLETGNDFFRDISRVRVFVKDEDFNSWKLQNIFIKEREIFATDGISGIIVENDNIPNEFQNTIISPTFSSMDDVCSCIVKDKGNDKTEINKPYDVLVNAFSTLEKSKYEKVSVSASSFFKEFMHRTDDSTGKRLSVLENNGNKLALNSLYLSIAVSVFDKENIDVFFPHFALNPIILKNEKQKVLVLPVRREGLEKM